MSDPITRHVQINGHQFRIWEKGTGEKIGFLAGIGGLTSWTPFLDHLAEESQVIVPSLPGFPGGSNLHTDLDNHLDWLIATHDLLTKSGLKGCHLIGASVGGSLAADAVALWPELANTLSLIAPFGLFDENEPVTDIYAQKPGQIRNLMCNNPEKFDIATSGLDGEDALENEVIQQRAHEAAARILWPLSNTGLHKRLHRIQNKTLLIWGEDDPVLPLNYAKKLEERITGTVSRSVISGARHLAELDQPREVADAVLHFALQNK